MEQRYFTAMTLLDYGNCLSIVLIITFLLKDCFDKSDDNVDDADCDSIPESSSSDVKSLLVLNTSDKGRLDSDSGRLARPDLVLITALFKVKLLASPDIFTGRLKLICTRIKPSNE